MVPEQMKDSLVAVINAANVPDSIILISSSFDVILCLCDDLRIASNLRKM